MQDKALVLDDEHTLPFDTSEKVLYTDVGFNTLRPFYGKVIVNEAVSEPLTVEFQASDTEAFTNVFTLGSSGEVAVADLQPGEQIRVPLAFCPKNYPYIRAKYTGGTTGKITTLIDNGIQTMDIYPWPHP